MFPKIDLKKRIIIFSFYVAAFYSFLVSQLLNSLLNLILLSFIFCGSVVLGIYVLYYFLKERNMVDDYVIALLEGN